MPRVHATAPPEAIRIEDEVWQEAFTRREPVSESRRRRLRAVDGTQSDWLSEWVPAEPRRGGEIDAAESVARSAQPEANAPEFVAATWVGTQTASPPADPSPTSYAGLYAETAPPVRAETAPPVRRTVKIQGRGAERNMPLPSAARRRPARRPYERAGFRPDRLAMWAVVLGFLLVLVAIASGHG